MEYLNGLYQLIERVEIIRPCYKISPKNVKIVEYRVVSLIIDSQWFQWISLLWWIEPRDSSRSPLIVSRVEVLLWKQWESNIEDGKWKWV